MNETVYNTLDDLRIVLGLPNYAEARISNSKKRITELKQAGKSARDICSELEISRTTLWRMKDDNQE